MEPLSSQLGNMAISSAAHQNAASTTFVPAMDHSFVKLASGVSGRIKSYCIFRGYGFIELERRYGDFTPTPDILLHQKHLDPTASNFAGLEHGKLKKVAPLKIGQEVLFDLYQKPAGALVAFQVKGAHGGDLVPDEEWIMKQDRTEIAKEVKKLQAQLAAALAKKAKVEGAGSDCLCVICKSKQACMMYVACNHVAACEVCHLQGGPQLQMTCMCCRKPNVRMVKVFLP